MKHKARRFLRRRRWLIPAALIFLALVLAGGYWMYRSVQSQNRHSIHAGVHSNVGSGYRDIVYQGKAYRYNSRVTAVLYAGVDSEGELKPYNRYTVAPRADSISLIVMDAYHGRMTIIALNRDTMTPIHRYTLNGRDRGLYTDHLGYAYTYGDGGQVSCENLCAAVSEMFYGVPINEYIVTNRSSLPLLAELIGAVEVVVPNDDLAEYGFAEGDTAIIDGSNLESYVRSRDIAEDLTNVGRMQRQQTYINAALERIRGLLENDASRAWRDLQAAEGVLQTNITRNRYLDLVSTLKKTSYDAQDYYIPEGDHVVGADHDEFYPDQEALLAKVVELFYIPK